MLIWKVNVCKIEKCKTETGNLILPNHAPGKARSLPAKKFKQIIHQKSTNKASMVSGEI